MPTVNKVVSRTVTGFRITVEALEEVTVETQDWAKGGPIESSGEYGYTPIRQTTQAGKSEIYTQTIGKNFDLAAVIRAANNMKEADMK